MEMPHPDQRIRALAGVIEECTGTEDAETYRMAVDAALAASKQVDYLIFLPQALEQIAGAQAIAGKLADALTTAARIQEVDERSRANLGFTLAKVARLQADAGDIDGSKETIRKTLAVAARAAGERAGNGILLQTLDAQIAAKDIEGARATAERLGERFRVAASIMLYGWYASAHENESANAMLELALRHTGSVDAGDDRATILGRVGVALAKAGDVDAARTIFQEALDAAAGIVDSRQHAVVLSRLSDAVREARDPESTRKVAESLRALIEGDGGTRKNPILLASVAANLAQLGDVTTAMAVTAMIGDMEERVRALVEVAATLPN
jgi:tetratricopeptide (TPR) repeat protein